MSSPIRTDRHMRIACIGAGASGLCFAYKLQRSFDNFSLTMYEKNSRVGGVWVENRYPGCACDYEAHNYSFSWEPKSDWTSVYASAPEVQGYFEGFGKKYGLLRYCKFDTTVIGGQWDDEAGIWKLILQTGETEHYDHCHILINASGVLNNYKWPDVAGLGEFGGLKIHSAAWPLTPVNISNKRVGLVGNGSSGQQLLEALQPRADHLTVFVRQPAWIFGPFGEPPRCYTAEEISSFRDQPETLLAKRKRFETRVNSYFSLCLRDSPQQQAMRLHLTESIKIKLAGTRHEDSRDLFVPKYSVGCRRPTPGTQYIESLCAPNVDLVVGEIRCVTPGGVADHQGKHHPLDVLICATGFDTSHKPRFPLLGRGGRNLQDIWSSEATAYLALAVPEFPNYFVFYGPNNPFASGAFLPTIEAQADYMLKWCDRWQTENILSFSPKQEAVDEFQEHTSHILQKTVWADDCNSWYKPSSRSPAISLWPGSGLHYMEAISSLRGDDFEVRYKGNRWLWLGNGLSQTEQDPSCDLAYYIRDRDDSEFLSSKKSLKSRVKGSPRT